MNPGPQDLVDINHRHVVLTDQDVFPRADILLHAEILAFA